MTHVAVGELVGPTQVCQTRSEGGCECICSIAQLCRHVRLFIIESVLCVGLFGSSKIRDQHGSGAGRLGPLALPVSVLTLLAFLHHVG